MVNSKKMSKSSVAIIVLSILLVLSMVLGLTGAWFTDKDSEDASTNINFGTVDINVTTATAGAWRTDSTVDGEHMPGDSYAATLNIANEGSQDVYYKVVVTAKLGDGTEIEGITVEADAAALGAEVVADSGIYALEAGDNKDVEFSIVLSTELLNEHQGKDYAVTFSVAVEAVQQANFVPGTTAWPTSFEVVAD